MAVESRRWGTWGLLVTSSSDSESDTVSGVLEKEW